METSKQVRMCETYAGISETELARRLDTSPQALGQKLKRNTLTPSDLALVAAAIGENA